MGREPGNLVAEPLGGDDGHLLQDLLVDVEVQGHARVVSLNHLARGFLHSLCTDAAHGAGFSLCECVCFVCGGFGRREKPGKEREKAK